MDAWKTGTHRQYLHIVQSAMPTITVTAGGLKSACKFLHDEGSLTCIVFVGKHRVVAIRHIGKGKMSLCCVR